MKVGTSTKYLYWKYVKSNASIYNWKEKLGGMKHLMQKDCGYFDDIAKIQFNHCRMMTCKFD